jgi:hypothetical protein
MPSLTRLTLLSVHGCTDPLRRGAVPVGFLSSLNSLRELSCEVMRWMSLGISYAPSPP